MKNLILLFFLLAIVAPAWSQKVEWAFKVLEHSSQEGEKDYAAKQALGQPNVLPASGQSANAWQPKLNRDEDFIKVGFATAIIPKQIIIAESFNPGYITKVFVYDVDGHETLVANASPSIVKGSRLLHINTATISFYVNAVKIVIRPGKDIPVAIDAIGITEYTKEFKMKEKDAGNLKSGIIPTRLGPTVNSPYMEIGPLPSPDGKTLYFSRRGHPGDIAGEKDWEDIWYAEWNETTKNWNEAKNMGAPLNNKDPNFITSISPDGNTIVLGNSYKEDGTMGDGVSISRRTATGWSTPQELNVDGGIDNSSDLTDFFLSNSQKILLMSVKRKKDTYGDRDLYVSFLTSDSVWSKPLNLGKTVNTYGVEMAPFLASDDKTLYYASTGLNGYGGSDIFMTRRLDDTWENWSEPENMGAVINTAGDEAYLTLAAAGDKVYFTSTSEDGNTDMYVVELAKKQKPSAVTLIKGRVLNSKTGEPIAGAKIHFENLVKGTEVGIAISNPVNGTYQIVLPSGNRFGYLAEKEGFISVHANLDVIKQLEYTEKIQDLYLTPIEIGQSVVINNIFFDFDKYDLMKESYLELDRLAKVLKDNASMQIEISGYTDNVGTEAYNDVLAQKRAESVRNYLLTKSAADASRITLKSYGESKPVASNKTSKGRQLNRRVEFKIIKM